ncbi:MAG: hypothetical protein JKP90_20510 [Desulfofustis sp. PB-SRB1]|nr:hypothetical protein [Desulfofustis sp. PB-SRB1]
MKGITRAGRALALSTRVRYLVSQALMPLFRFMGGNLQRNSEELLRMIA